MTTNHSGEYKLRLDLRTFDGDPEVIDPANPTDHVDPTEVVDPPAPDPENNPQPEGEFDTIKYNHEEVKLPVAERQNYLQKGYDYDKVRGERDSLQKQTERLAKLSGYQTTEDFIAGLDKLEEQLTVQQEAQKMGLDENDYKEFIAPTNKKVIQLESELNELRGLKLDMQLNDMGIQDKDIRKGVKELVQTKGYDPQDAYKILTYDTVGKTKEQEVLANITKREDNQVLSSKDKPGNLQFDPENMSLEDINKISERVQRGERITF